MYSTCSKYCTYAVLYSIQYGIVFVFVNIQYTEYFAVTTFFHAWVRTKLYDSFTSIGILSTIETCFDCFGTRSSDDNRNNKKMTKPPVKLKSYAASLNPPPLRERGVAKMVPVSEAPTTPALWVKNFILY